MTPAQASTTTTSSRASGSCAFGAWAVLFLAGCGPTVDLPSADDSASAGEDTGPGDAASTGGLDDGSSSGEVETGEAPTGWCSHRVALTAMGPAERVVDIVDNDGDGRQEVWTFDPGHGRIGVFQADDSGLLVLAAEHSIDGSSPQMGDVDGDGYRDVIVTREDQAVWFRAEGELGLGSEASVLDVPPPTSPASTWLDADGDGAVDYVESIFDSLNPQNEHIRLHMNDGAGGFFLGDELSPDGFELDLLSIRVHPVTDGPGRLLVAFQEHQSLVDGPYQVHAIEVSGDGRIDVLARTDGVSGQRIVRVRDFDGNGIPDVAGYAGIPPWDLDVAMGRADGTFEITESIPIEVAVVHDFDGDADGRHDLLIVDEDGTYVRWGTGDGFADPEPLFETGVVDDISRSWPVQIDGLGGFEVLETVYGAEHEYALRTIDPCS